MYIHMYNVVLLCFWNTCYVHVHVFVVYMCIFTVHGVCTGLYRFLWLWRMKPVTLYMYSTFRLHHCSVITLLAYMKGYLCTTFKDWDVKKYRDFVFMYTPFYTCNVHVCWHGHVLHTCLFFEEQIDNNSLMLFVFFFWQRCKLGNKNWPPSEHKSVKQRNSRSDCVLQLYVSLIVSGLLKGIELHVHWHLILCVSLFDLLWLMLI